ncbi:YncE family protein [Rhodococcus sp. SJ-2]
MTASGSVTRRVLTAAAVGAGATAIAVSAAHTAAADPLSDCVRNAGGIVTVDGASPVAPVFGFDGLMLLGVDGGTGNSCITNVGPGTVNVTHPEGREPGRTHVTDAPLEMRVDGGIGNVAVTNLGTGGVTVDRHAVAPRPQPAASEPELLPQMELDAGSDGVFVTNIGTGSVEVIDWDHARGPLPAEIPAPPGMVVTDPITGNVYVTNFFGPAVTVVDRAGGSVSRVVEKPDPVTALDHGTSNVFVTNIGGGAVTVVRG